MLEAWRILARHMERKHPNAVRFGDSLASDGQGKVLTHSCQLCGKSLMDLYGEDWKENSTEEKGKEVKGMIKLGQNVRDKLTGVWGVATARCEQLHGPNLIMIESAHEGKNVQEWIVEERAVEMVNPKDPE